MAGTMVKTVIINQTQQVLVLRIGNRNCFAKLATIEIGGEHEIEIDVNWTYHEFSLEAADCGAKKVLINSDDCFDYEQITVTEGGGNLEVSKVARFRASCKVDELPVLASAPTSYFTWPPTWLTFR